MKDTLNVPKEFSDNSEKARSGFSTAITSLDTIAAESREGKLLGMALTQCRNTIEGFKKEFVSYKFFDDPSDLDRVYYNFDQFCTLLLISQRQISEDLPRDVKSEIVKLSLKKVGADILAVYENLRAMREILAQVKRYSKQ
jgi:hypothetical protein